jgi:hypothetical protein
MLAVARNNVLCWNWPFGSFSVKCSVPDNFKGGMLEVSEWCPPRLESNFYVTLSKDTQGSCWSMVWKPAANENEMHYLYETSPRVNWSLFPPRDGWHVTPTGDEASFTFATCTALAVRYSLRLEEWAYALLYYGPQTKGELATARLPPLGGWVIYF